MEKKKEEKKKAIEEQKENPDQSLIDSYSYPEKYKIDDIIGKKLVYYPHDSIYSYQAIEKEVISTTIKNPLTEETIAETNDLAYSQKAGVPFHDSQQYQFLLCLLPSL